MTVNLRPGYDETPRRSGSRACVPEERAGTLTDSCPRGRGQILGGRSTVGHVALDHVIGVRIPASQPPSLARKLGSLGGCSARLPVIPRHADAHLTQSALCTTIRLWI